MVYPHVFDSHKNPIEICYPIDISSLTVWEVLNLGVEDLKLDDIAGMQVTALALYCPGAGPSFC